MPLDWSGLSGLRNRQAVYKQLKQAISADTYGDGPGQWTLTELINERSNSANTARRIIEGVNQDGSKDGSGAMRGKGGQEFTVKLRVLSRQACTRDAEGKPINYWDVTDEGEDGTEHCPATNDKPLEGDEVWVKGDPITHHPEEGHRLRKQDRMALHARKEAELGFQCKQDLALFYWRKYPVDADGCITPSYTDACQLLTTKGKRLVLPEFTTGSKKKSKKDKNVKRLITNWLFEEVPPSTDKTPAPKRGGKG